MLKLPVFFVQYRHFKVPKIDFSECKICYVVMCLQERDTRAGMTSSLTEYDVVTYWYCHYNIVIILKLVKY